MSTRRPDLEARTHQRRRVVAAWLTGDADPGHTDPGPSPRWLLAGLAAGVLTMGGWVAVGLLDLSPPEVGHEREPAPMAVRCD